jgi:hypothetical protein
MGVGVRIARRAGAANNYGEVGERAQCARVHEWYMAAQPPRARCAHIVERGAKKGKQLRNLREYMNGTCREHEARVCAHRNARRAQRA